MLKERIKNIVTKLEKCEGTKLYRNEFFFAMVINNEKLFVLPKQITKLYKFHNGATLAYDLTSLNGHQRQRSLFSFYILIRMFHAG